MMDNSPLSVAPRYIPWRLEGARTPLGFVPYDAAWVLENSGVMVAEDAELILRAGEVSRVLDDARIALHAHGLIESERGERMPIMAAPFGPTLGDIDRSAMRILGLWAIKVHINGLCRHDDTGNIFVWLARRSRQSRAAPGAFDTMVAGGVPVSEDCWQTALKEAWEEAGITQDLCADMRATSERAALYISDQGYHREQLVAYDLLLDPTFEPVCQDGEIETFCKVDLTELTAAMVTKVPMKESSRLICEDLVLRLGPDVGTSTL
jgi:8-oxo-dGTP pyrophosphatase MutT (NUDIX family)